MGGGGRHGNDDEDEQNDEALLLDVKLVHRNHLPAKITLCEYNEATKCGSAVNCVSVKVIGVHDDDDDEEEENAAEQTNVTSKLGERLRFAGEAKERRRRRAVD